MEIESQLASAAVRGPRKRRRRRWGFGRGALAVRSGGAVRQPRAANGSLADNNRFAETPSGRLTLERAPAGQELCVTSLGGDHSHAQRLRELGMFEGQRVRVLTAGNPLICQVGDCRFGMCRRLARCILVEPYNRSSAQSA